MKNAVQRITDKIIDNKKRRDKEICDKEICDKERFRHGLSGRRTSRIFKVSACACLILAAVSELIFTPLTAQASPAYPSKYTQTVSIAELVKPALVNQWNDSDNMYEQLEQMLLYKSIDQGQLITYAQQGVKIPAAALQKLAVEGLISGYVYKTVAGLSYEPSDFKDVFDANYYYAVNPDLQGIVANDENSLFNHFITVGMAQGRTASVSFNPVIFMQNYPQLAAGLGNSFSNFYTYYIVYGKDKGLVANKLLKQK